MTVRKSLKRRVRARMEKTGERYSAARRQVVAKAGEPDEALEVAASPLVHAMNGVAASTAADVADSRDERGAAVDAAAMATVKRPGADQDRAASRSVAAGAGDSARGSGAATSSEGGSVKLGMSDEAIRRKTGKGWDEWLAVIDAWGGTKRTHTEIASWIRDELGVDGWWAQGITVGYERARGMRAMHQLVDGFSATGSKTVNVPVERLYEAFADDAVRERWLPGVPLALSSPRPPKSLHAGWVVETGEAPAHNTRLDFLFTSKGEGKSQVAVQQIKLHDAAEAEAMKGMWRERLAALKAMLED